MPSDNTKSCSYPGPTDALCLPVLCRASRALPTALPYPRLSWGLHMSPTHPQEAAIEQTVLTGDKQS